MKSVIFAVIAAAVMVGLNFAQSSRPQPDVRDMVVNQMPRRAAKLADRQYSGTFDDVLRQRIADVNDVRSFAVEIRQEAARQIDQGREDVSDRQMLMELIRGHTQEDRLKSKLLRNQLLEHAAQMTCASALDSSGAEYIDTVERYSEFMEALLELAQPL